MNEELNPITREEMFLAKAAGQNTPDLKPITRVERFLQNLIDHVKSIGTGGSGGGATPDWNAAEGEPGHVLNRPFYSEFKNGVVLPETVPTYDEGFETYALSAPLSVVSGEKYTVNWNGVEYVTDCVEFDQGDGIVENVIGNISAMTESGDTGEPFVIMNLPAEMAASAGVGALVIPFDGATDITISVTGMTETVHPIPQKYIAESLNVAGEMLKEYVNTAIRKKVLRSNIDIQLGSSSEEFTEDDWTELHNANGGVLIGQFTILGKDYWFTFPGYIRGFTWCASITFNEVPGSLNQGGAVYNLQIFMGSTGHTNYYLRELHQRVTT